jgi:hypothetical protein
MAPRVDSDCPAVQAKRSVSCYDECASLAKLPALTPTAMEPECASERGRAVLALSTIDAIRVTRHPTRESFVVEVFTGSGGIVSPSSGGEFCEDDSHIPTRLRDRHASIPMHRRFAMTSELTDDMDIDGGALCKRTPVVTFEKQLGEFTQFRDALYNATLPAHSRVLMCDYCREVIEYALWAHKVPAGLGLRMLFHREEELDKVAKLLSAFLSELLARTLSPPCIERAAAAAAQGDLVAAAGVPWCRAQSSVPVVVHTFLMQTRE